MWKERTNIILKDLGDKGYDNTQSKTKVIFYKVKCVSGQKNIGAEVVLRWPLVELMLHLTRSRVVNLRKE